MKTKRFANGRTYNQERLHAVHLCVKALYQSRNEHDAKSFTADDWTLIYQAVDKHMEAMKADALTPTNPLR